jgi:ribosomal protein S18 acetylase RimI-like enzyme
MTPHGRTTPLQPRPAAAKVDMSFRAFGFDMLAESGVVVRPGRPEDLSNVVRTYGTIGVNPWDPFVDEHRLATIPLNGLLIAEKDGTYAGFLYWFEGHKPWFDKGADQYAELKELHVLREFEGWGIAERLVNRFLEDVSRQEIPLVYVATDETNRSGHHLYEQAGFRPFLRTVHYRRYG